MKELIGFWLVGEAILLMLCWIDDEPKWAVAMSIFLALICTGSYLIAS